MNGNQMQAPRMGSTSDTTRFSTGKPMSKYEIYTYIYNEMLDRQCRVEVDLDMVTYMALKNPSNNESVTEKNRLKHQLEDITKVVSITKKNMEAAKKVKNE